MMNRRELLRGVAGTALFVTSTRLAAAAADAPTATDGVGGAVIDDRRLAELLARVRDEHRLPGIAAAVVRGRDAVAAAVAGVREAGREERIALDDRFLVGSCTKRMTAAMVCRLIDAGKLAFDTPLEKALPDIEMRAEYRPVTVAQLLTFTGGIRPYMRVDPQHTPALFDRAVPAERRQEGFVRQVLNEPPAAEPGTKRVYSNASYAVAAFVASRRTGRTWEAMMTEEVFMPLKMTRAGFGRPQTAERPDEPRLHRKTDAGAYEVEPAERGGGGGDRPMREADMQLAMAGPGGVHCPIRDFARFVAYELAAARGRDPLLKPETARRWLELSRRGEGGGGAEGRPVRGGTPWITAGYVLWPSKDLAAAVTVNGGGAFDACKAVFAAVEPR